MEGTDEASFTFDASTRQIKTLLALDYETKSSYSVTIKVSDGTDSDTVVVTITVTDLDEEGPSLLDRYDANDNDQIDVDELREAITHYILGDIDVDDVREIIRLYILG